MREERANFVEDKRSINESMVRRFTIPVALALLLFGSVGGPTRDSYKPACNAIAKPFKGQVGLIESQDLFTILKHCVDNRYIRLGTSDYMEKYPEMVELTVQAKKVGASMVVYHAALPGYGSAWSLGVNAYLAP
jgi:hypothetical protein